VLEATDTVDGLLIAHIASRGPGDPSAAELLRPQYLRTMDQYRAAVVYDAWLAQVMSGSDFEDYHPITD
jgi:hypothetical protein